MSNNSLPPIVRPYLLCTDVPCYRDAAGRRYLDPLWHKDLLEHVRYLRNLTIACPFSQTPDATHLVPLDDPQSPLSCVHFAELPRTISLLDAIGKLPRLAVVLWQAVGRADICHAGVSSWPIALAWLVLPIACLRRKFSIIVVENSAWRLDANRPHTIRHKLRAMITEKLNRWCINASSLAVFTHEGYLRDMLSGDRHHGHVIPASWVDEDDVLTDTEAVETWRHKVAAVDCELRLLFVGRLVEEKGVTKLLEAMRHVAAGQLSIKLDVVGVGPLAAECQAAAENIEEPAHVQLLGPASYGDDLFQLIREHHAVVIPSQSDEQPRIVFDAFSQAVPVLVTRTDGLRAWVDEGRTGFVARSNDALGLADLLTYAQQNSGQLERMGFASLEVARQWTHQSMHRARWALLVAEFREEAAQPPASGGSGARSFVTK